jgi:hypothetical protein
LEHLSLKWSGRVFVKLDTRLTFQEIMKLDIQMPGQQTFREGSVSQRIIEPSQVYDPLLVLLKIKLRLDDWWIIIGWGTLIFGLLLTIAAILPIERWNGRDFFSPLEFLLFAAAYLVMIGTYLSLPSTIADLSNRLWENGVIGDGQADMPGSLSYQAFVEKQVPWIHSRWWAAIALLAAALNPLFIVFAHPEMMRSIPVWLDAIAVFIVVAGNYGIVLVFIWLLMIAIITHRLFRTFTVRVKPLHPDGSGGLGPFNRLLWITTPLVVIAGCAAPVFWGSASSQSDRILILGDVVFYLLAAALPLRAWLALPRQAMVQARNKLLQPLIHEYEQTLSEMLSGARGDVAAIKEGTERLAALRTSYEEVRDSIPTWPIEIVQLRGLVTLLILPVLLTLLPLLLGLFAK